MIIVEGSDHTGKTTFCHKLVEELGGEYEHMSKPDADFDYWTAYIDKLIVGRVLDRFHFGAFVYGAMLGLHPVDGWTLRKMALITQYIRLSWGVIVLMYDSHSSAYKERITKSNREEMFKPGPIQYANQVFQLIPQIDHVDYVFDVKGGTKYPSDFDVKAVAAFWRIRNGL